jgi:hypothetical protein
MIMDFLNWAFTGQVSKPSKEYMLNIRKERGYFPYGTVAPCCCGSHKIASGNEDDCEEHKTFPYSPNIGGFFDICCNCGWRRYRRSGRVQAPPANWKSI